MQISPPIDKKPNLPNLRVAVMVRSMQENWHYSRSRRVQHTRELLAMVCREPVKVNAVSDASLPSFDRDGLAASVRAIETGEIDLAIAESCYEISCVSSTIREVVRRCIDNGVRFIAFQDHIDTAEPDYASYLERYLADCGDEDDE